MKRWNRSFLVLALSITGGLGVAQADTVFSTSTADTTAGSSVTPNSDGSFTLQTIDSGKASLYFFTGSPLGTLGNLSNFSATFRTDSIDSLRPSNELAFRFFLGSGASLVWENNYQATQATPSNIFQTVNFTTGNFWEHSKTGSVSSNFNGGSQAQLLSTWDTGTVHYIVDGDNSAATNVPVSSADLITSIQVSYGSGLGAFTGTVEDVKMDFGPGGSAFLGGPSFVGAPSVAATPLPSTAWQGAALLGGLGLFAAAKRRKSVPAL